MIRRQFRTVEGDPFNPREIRQAAERIRALGFFADAQVNAEPGSSGDQVVVNVGLDEQPTGSLSLVEGVIHWDDRTCERGDACIAACPIDLCFAGIGENSHLAFNDPPADFETEVPYIVVNLDHACRQQQFGEGWFPTFDDVPKQAVSMSIRQIMKSACLILSVPDKRKATAVKGTVEGPVTPTCPASIVQQHADCTLYVDAAAASELSR